jgi:hypothetical protein
MAILLNVMQNTKQKTFLKSFYEAIITLIPKPEKKDSVKRKKKYRPKHFMNTDVMQSKFKSTSKGLFICSSSSQRFRDGSIYANQ